MQTLDVESAFTILKLIISSHSGRSLSEQAQSYLAQNPDLILDVEGIQFNSLLIGELINLHKAFTTHWAGRPHRIRLVNLTDFSHEVLRRINLHSILDFEDVSGAPLGIPRKAVGD